jgi:hypothetical protein
MTDLAMNDDRNIGEKRARIARNRRLSLYGVLLVAGMAVGFLFGLYETDGTAWIAQGNIPGWLAILLASVTAFALIGGTIAAHRRVDEVERQNNLFSSAMAAGVVLVGYPVWYILWKGQLVSEPSHETMFVALYSVLLVTYLYRKFR